MEDTLIKTAKKTVGALSFWSYLLQKNLKQGSVLHEGETAYHNLVLIQTECEESNG